MSIPDDPADKSAREEDPAQQGARGPTEPNWPPGTAHAAEAGPQSPSQTGSRSMPELGVMPLRGHREGHLKVVRLVSTTPGADLSIELLPGLNKIGRQREDNHIVLVSPQVSRFHAEIDVSDDAVVLRDLGSGNGTYLNGTSVTEHRLQAGDLIAFSDRFTFRVMVDLATQPPETLTLEGVAAPDEARKTSGRIAKLASDSVPASLVKRTADLKRSSPDLDTDSLKALIEATPRFRTERGARCRMVTAERPPRRPSRSGQLSSALRSPLLALKPQLTRPTADRPQVGARGRWTTRSNGRSVAFRCCIR
jgi:predicted component of type VI protein secretion system